VKFRRLHRMIRIMRHWFRHEWKWEFESIAIEQTAAEGNIKPGYRRIGRADCRCGKAGLKWGKISSGWYPGSSRSP
jgi:hypothetical protein